MDVKVRCSLHVLDGIGSDPLSHKLHRATQRRRLVVEEGLLEVHLRACNPFTHVRLFTKKYKKLNFFSEMMQHNGKCATFVTLFSHINTTIHSVFDFLDFLWTPTVELSHHLASEAHLQFLLRPVGHLRVFGLGRGGCDLADDPAALGSATGHEGSQELPELACNRHKMSQPMTSKCEGSQMTSTYPGMDSMCRGAADPPK